MSGIACISVYTWCMPETCYMYDAVSGALS